jgi:hypothetical protein
VTAGATVIRPPPMHCHQKNESTLLANLRGWAGGLGSQHTVASCNAHVAEPWTAQASPKHVSQAAAGRQQVGCTRQREHRGQQGVEAALQARDPGRPWSSVSHTAAPQADTPGTRAPSTPRLT